MAASISSLSPIDIYSSTNSPRLPPNCYYKWDDGEKDVAVAFPPQTGSSAATRYRILATLLVMLPAALFLLVQEALILQTLLRQSKEGAEIRQQQRNRVELDVVVVTKGLKSNEDFHGNHSDQTILNSTSMENTHNQSSGDDIFLPGALSLTREQSFSRCYANPDTFPPQMFYGTKRTTYCSESKKVALVHYHINQPGISTQMRTLVKESLGEGDEPRDCPGKNIENKAMHHVAVIQDPLERFLRQFLLKASNPHDRATKSLSSESANSSALHQHVLDFRNQTLQTIREMASDSSILSPYVSLLQVGSLIDPQSGRPFHSMEKIIDFHNLTSEFAYLADRLQIPLADFTPKTMPMNTQVGIDKRIELSSTLDIETQRKICKLTALDYCCLNLRLPPACLGLKPAVQCRWTSLGHDVDDELLIDTLT